MKQLKDRKLERKDEKKARQKRDIHEKQTRENTERYNALPSIDTRKTNREAAESMIK